MGYFVKHIRQCPLYTPFFDSKFGLLYSEMSLIATICGRTSPLVIVEENPARLQIFLFFFFRAQLRSYTISSLRYIPKRLSIIPEICDPQKRYIDINTS
jgi:hypothetical protein